MRRTVKSLVTLVTVLLLVFVAGCIPAPAEITPAPVPAPEPTPSLPAGMGMIEVRVTDPPPPEMDHIWVEIENLEVHKAGGPWTTIAVNPEPFDLKEIEEIEAFLASQAADVGRYTQLRLDVKTVTVVVGEDEHDAKVPSGKIKLVGTFEVVENNTTVITLDFDGEKSVLVTGGGNYIFKPVIKLLVSGAPVAPVPGAPLALEITTTSLPDGEVGADYTDTLEATGGTEPYTWSIDGSLPDGLELDSDTGVISGNSTAEGDYEFTVQVEDSSDPVQSDTQEFSISIAAAGELEITTTSLPDGEVGADYTATLEAIGGTEPYTWSIDGSLPDGLELDSDTGVISGNSTAEGDYEFTVQVEDNSDPVQSDTEEFSISIAAAGELEITTTSLPDGEVGVAYTATVEATGGTQPYTWSIDGSLPDGLELDSDTGVISGNSTAEGDYEFTVQVEDSSDPVQSDTQEFSIDIEAEELEFEGTIEAIAGDNWTMTIDDEEWTVDVSGADIEGEPAVGLEAEVKGTVVDDTIVASEVEIKE